MSKEPKAAGAAVEKSSSTDLPAGGSFDIAKAWPDVLTWASFGLLMLFFVVMKSFSLHWEVGDENIYFYMAWASADHGALPYRDFFFAHPLLHLLPGIPLFKFFGVSNLTARLIPGGAAAIGATFLFLLAKRHLGRLGGVATLFFYLTAYDLLRASTHWTGINLAVMWMVIGLWALLGKRPLLAGVFLALGVCTGNYILPGALMAGMLALLQSRKVALRYALGFAAPWIALQFVGLVLGGGAYIDAVYRYHVQKPDTPGGTSDLFLRVFFDNFPLFFGTLVGSALAFLDRLLSAGWTQQVGPKPVAKWEEEVGWRRIWGGLGAALLESGPRGIAWIGGLWALGTVLFIARLARVFPYYFLLMFPAMALVAGFAVDRIVAHAVGLFKAARGKNDAWKESVFIFVVVVGIAMGGHMIRESVQRAALPNYARTADRPMQWCDAPVPSWINGLLRRCCFDDVAKAYVDYGTIQEALYHESQYFEQAQDLADYVRVHSSPEETLFGDSSTAGLVALLSGRRLAADEADTNFMRFKSGITSATDLIAKIDTPSLRYVLVSGSVTKDKKGQSSMRYGAFASGPEFKRWLDDKFQVAHQSHDRTKGTFFLLERKQGLP